MSTIASGVDGDLDAIKTLDALDDFEKSLLTLREKRDFPSERIRRDIPWRREALEEYEPREDPANAIKVPASPWNVR
ncbi:hypothetical protein [Sphingobium sp. HWE2-09]|uniref:hypothetical protein n=1 Tax=Sphingobium sp. HWE2-09 TaxID=3108390 RepID=UPI002DC11401|nr:hypothetical protein [Sphingobium sp. HWE2-09]